MPKKDPLQASMKFVHDSLSFLDNAMIRWGLIVLLVLYAVLGVPNFPYEVSAMFHNPIVQFAFLLAIAYIGIKDLGVALSLALVFVASLYYGRGGAGIMALPRAVLGTGEAAFGRAEGVAGDVLGMGQSVMDTVLSGAGSVEADIQNTAQYLTGDLMSDKGGPEGYNSTVNCYAACDTLLPFGPQCQGGDIQGMTCPQSGYQPGASDYARV